MKSSGLFPSGAALKTTVRPSGANSARKIGSDRKVNGLNVNLFDPAGRSRSPPREKGRKTHTEQEREAGRNERPLGPGPADRRDRQSRGHRHAGEGLEIEGKIVHRVESALGVLLQAVPHDAFERRAKCSGW